MQVKLNEEPSYSKAFSIIGRFISGGSVFLMSEEYRGSLTMTETCVSVVFET